jgi:hypothetical protein
MQSECTPDLFGHANSLSAPLQRPIRSVQILRIYDAPSLLRKDNRFDQQLPSIRGSKVLRKIFAAARNNVPAVYPQSDFARDGGLLSYGGAADPVEAKRRAALM